MKNDCPPAYTECRPCSDLLDRGNHGGFGIQRPVEPPLSRRSRNTSPSRSAAWLAFVALAISTVTMSAGCSSAARESTPPLNTPAARTRPDSGNQDLRGDSLRQERGNEVETGLHGASDPAVPAKDSSTEEFPAHALYLLTKSTTDSCAVCAEKRRNEAFELLDGFYRPGSIVTNGPTAHFFRVPGGENELALTSYDRAAPKLTFRFHSSVSHLVGIAAADLTDQSVVDLLDAASDGTKWQGTLQLAEYAYGDGATFLYFPANDHLQIQCKVLEITPE